MNIVDGTVRLKINILGYEYPNAKDEDDANWLIVDIEASDSNGLQWHANDPCLRVSELADLKEWLIAIIKNKGDIIPRLYFMENELSFIHKGNFVVSIALDYAFHPKSIKYDYVNDEEYILTFSLNEKSIEKIINELDCFIFSFPEKREI